MYIFSLFICFNQCLGTVCMCLCKCMIGCMYADFSVYLCQIPHIAYACVCVCGINIPRKSLLEIIDITTHNILPSNSANERNGNSHGLWNTPNRQVLTN